MSTEKTTSRLPGPGFADLEQLPWALSQRDLLTTALAGCPSASRSHTVS